MEQKLELTREDIIGLRMMIRVLAVQRLAELVTTARKREEVTNSAFLTEILRYTDLYRTFDHHMVSYFERCQAANSEAVEVVLTEEALNFYRNICGYNYAPGQIKSGVYDQMIDVCKASQVRIKKKIDAVIGEVEPMVTNMRAATEKN